MSAGHMTPQRLAEIADRVQAGVYGLPMAEDLLAEVRRCHERLRRVAELDEQTIIDSGDVWGGLGELMVEIEAIRRDFPPVPAEDSGAKGE